MSGHERRWPSSRSDSQSSLSSSSSRAPMTIPQSRPAEAPPPLPPPRFNEDLANGHDLGWKWGNPALAGGFEKLAPIKQNSSLFGGYRLPRVDQHGYGEHAEEMDLDSEFDRRGSTVSTIRSPSQPEVMLGGLACIQSSGERTPSPTALSTQRFATPVVRHVRGVMCLLCTIIPQFRLRHCNVHPTYQTRRSHSATMTRAIGRFGMHLHDTEADLCSI